MNIFLDRLKEKLQSKMFSVESSQSVDCLNIESRSSDSELLSSCNTELYSTGMHNFFDMKQLWINTIIATKSRTSFLLNRKKLDKFLLRCNADIPDKQDLRFEQQALISLMSGQRMRSKRNSRNVHR